MRLYFIIVLFCPHRRSLWTSCCVTREQKHDVEHTHKPATLTTTSLFLGDHKVVIYTHMYIQHTQKRCASHHLAPPCAMVAKMHGAGNRSVVTSSCWRWQTDCLHSPPPSVMYRHKKQVCLSFFVFQAPSSAADTYVAYCCCVVIAGDRRVYITLEQSLDDHLRTLFPLSLSLSLSFLCFQKLLDKSCTRGLNIETLNVGGVVGYKSTKPRGNSKGVCSSIIHGRRV